MANTGYKAWTTLKKVTDDANEYPLDVNGDLCSVSGLPQATKPNTEGQPDYVAPVTDYVTCPVSGSTDYLIKVDQFGAGTVRARSYNKSTDTLADLPVDVIVSFIYKLTSESDYASNSVTIVSGTQSATKKVSTSVSILYEVIKISVSPTSYGGGTIE